MSNKISEYFQTLKRESGATFTSKQWEVLEKIATDIHSDLEDQIEHVASDLSDLTNDCQL
jgi:hypothetical protein